MQKELGNLGAAIGMCTLIALFFGLAMAIYPGWEAIGKWLHRADAPAWMQAIGSLVGLAVAIAVVAIPRWMDENNRKKETHLKGKVRAAELDLQCRQIAAALLMMRTRMKTSAAGTKIVQHTEFASWIDGLLLPTDEQIFAVEPIDHALALCLVHGRTKVRQISHIVHLLRGQSEPEDRRYRIGKLEELIDSARSDFERAFPALAQIVVSVGGVEILPTVVLEPRR